MKSLQAKFETENDVDYYKLIVTHPGMLKLLFTPQDGQLCQKVTLLDEKGETITTIETKEQGKEVVLSRSLSKKGIYYIKIYFVDRRWCGNTWCTATWYNLSQDSEYTLKILPMAGLLLANTECSEADIESCQSEVDCVTYGGYWYDNSCHIEACNEKFLSICPDEEACKQAGGHWSETKEFCFNGDISDIESQLANIKEQGYQEGIKFCKANPEECGIEISKQNCEEQTSKEQPTEIETDSQDSCASYNMFTNTLHIPCLSIGTESYWIDMMLEGTEPIKFELKNFGKN